MKSKTILYLVSFIVIITAGYFLFESQFNKQHTVDEYQNHTGEGLASDGFANDQIEQAIARYLESEDRFAWKNSKDSHSLCVIENLLPEQELFPLSIWAYCGEYVIEDGALVLVSGSSGPALINYPNELSYYRLQEFSYQAPGDGANYARDIQNIFSTEAQARISAFDVSPLVKRSEAEAFTIISNWNRITQAAAECKITQVMQTHALEVSATLTDGSTITAREPYIDNIFEVIDQHSARCDEVIMATE